MPSSSSIFIIALLAVATSATPLSSSHVQRQTVQENCSPNFEGVGVSVTNSAREWAASAPERWADVTSGTSYRGGAMLSVADFRFEQTGSPVTSYIIKDIDHNELVVGFSDEQKLQLKYINTADLSQNWKVSCDHCETDISQLNGLVANGCNVTSITNDRCVQIAKSTDDPMFLADCDNSDSQNFDFWTAVRWDSHIS